LEAIKHFNGALDQIKDLSLPSLRGNILQARAEAWALAQRSQDCWRSIGLAEHILGREEKSHEQSYVLFDASSTARWKGVYALLLGDYERAITLFDKGLVTCNPTLTPARARFLSRKAEACYGAGKIGECIETAQEAFDLAHTVGQNSTIERVSTLHTTLSQSRWNKEQGVRRLGASLAQHYHDK
jgi:tetratricopeptide (TPR) repeat protein